MRKYQPKPLPNPEPQQPVVQLTRQQLIRKQLGNVQDNIINLFENNSLSINKAKVPFLSKEEKQSKQSLIYQQLLAEKRKMQLKIKQLQETEIKYMEKSRISDKNKNSLPAPKSELSLEDKDNLKRLKKKLKDFQESVKKKDEEIQLSKVRLARQEQEKLAKERSAANQLKKAKIAQKLQQIKEKNIQRQSKIKSQNLVLKKIEQKKKLFQLLDENWKQKNSQEEKKKQELMTLRLKQKNINFSALKQHEKKYEQIIQQKKKILQDKRLGSSRQSEHSFSGQKSKFYTIILKEDHEAKLREEKKKQQRKMLQQKRDQYAKYVRQQLAPQPKLNLDQQQDSKSQQKQPKITRLTKEQVVQMGNYNLRQGNKRAKKKQNRDVNNTNIAQQTRKNEVSSMSHYSDYLREARKLKQEQKYYSGFYNSPKNEAERIMNSSSIKKEDKIGKLRLLASRFDSSAPDIITKIQGKLQILEVIN